MVNFEDNIPLDSGSQLFYIDKYIIRSMRKSRTRFVDDEMKVVAGYLAGKSTLQLAKEFGWSPSPVINILKRYNIKRRSPSRATRFSEEQVRLVLKLYDSGLAKNTIRKRLGLSHHRPIDTLLRKYGRSVERRFPEGDLHYNWKGGKGFIGDYIEVKLPRKHWLYGKVPLSGGRIREHRFIMAEYLGRPLEKYEEVHHINGVKTDNRLENLQLRAHKHGAGVVLRCRTCNSMDIIQTKIDEPNIQQLTLF